MFQNFDKKPAGSDPKRLAALRDRLRAEGLAGFIVPHSDEHQSEYLPPSAERLAWLTGFTGSAGLAIVLADEAAVFVDGRYTLQAAAEVNASAFAVLHSTETPASVWLSARLKAGDRIGFDPWLSTLAEMRRYEKLCAAAGASLVALAQNPIDAVWTDRPAPPVGQVSLQPLSFAGDATADKLSRLSKQLTEKKADTAILTLADSIAWTFNIRGKDVTHNPVPLAFAILRREGRPTLLVDGRKLSNAVRAELIAIADIAEPSTLHLEIDKAARSGPVLLDPDTAAAAIALRILDAGGRIVEATDPSILPKARKNSAEISGTRSAHLRDGVAVTRFLAWLDTEAPKGRLDEIGAAQKLEQFRTDTAIAEGSELADISFDTISGAGPNGAVVHYRVSHSTNRPLDQNSLFLIDSGGQYRDGTTDITRTVAIGTPTAEMRRRFTLVLKGHIAIARARFPTGTTGSQIDALARLALWEAGLDYDHGTGHGVGSFLSVHEGPARISKAGSAVPLEPGMILSNEPGNYKAGEYGIRIENLVLVREPEPVAGGERPMLSFETLSLAPIDLRLVDAALLTAEERAWLNAYHARVAAEIGPRLTGADRAWLDAATRPV